MKPRRLCRLTPEPSLFDPPQPLPRWETLPAQNRQEAVWILIRMLLEHRSGRAEPLGKGVAHE